MEKKSSQEGYPSLLTLLLGTSRPFVFMQIFGWTSFAITCACVGFYYLQGCQNICWLNILIPFVTIILCIINKAFSSKEKAAGHESIIIADKVCNMELVIMCLASLSTLIAYILHYPLNWTCVNICLLLIPGFGTAIVGLLSENKIIQLCSEFGLTMAIISLTIMGDGIMSIYMEYCIMILSIVNLIVPGYIGGKLQNNERKIQ